MSDEQPAPRRRRVAPAVMDPMAPQASVSPAAVPGTPASARGPAPQPVATPSIARGGPTLGRKLRAEPTVPVFLRTSTTSKEQFEALAGAAGLTQRAMFEELVARAFHEQE